MLFRFDPFDPVETGARRPSMLAMDAVRTEDAVFVYFDAPGIDADDLELTVERDELTVAATRRWNDPDSHTITSEREQGMFRRTIHVGDSLDTDEISATLEEGVLTIEIPVREGSKPRTIEVSSTSTPELVTSS